jgi:uncharacterized phage protein (TIGR02220 family)
MKSIVIPLEFLKAIGEKPPYTRIYWVKWLADYTDELFRNDFPTYFQKQMEDKKLNLETIKEAYEFGIVFFKDGFTFLDEKPTNKPSKEELEVVEKVILYLNEKSNSTYTTNKTNTTYILARLKEGFSLVDFKRVIDKKSAQWLGTEQQKYLRPNTLFLPSKFENYLNESEIINIKDAKPIKQSAIDKLSNASSKAKEFFNGGY